MLLYGFLHTAGNNKMKRRNFSLSWVKFCCLRVLLYLSFHFYSEGALFKNRKDKKMNIGRTRTILVTVGTTEFDELLQQLDSNMMTGILDAFQCKKLIIQRGRGVYKFHELINQTEDECLMSTKKGVEVEIFRFCPDLVDLIKNVDLVVGHAGAGTVLEVANAKKLFLVVVNPTLQDNHQEELARAIVSMGSSKCVVARLDDIFSPFRQLIENNSARGIIGDDIMFPILNSSNFAGFLDDMFSFQKLSN